MSSLIFFLLCRPGDWESKQSWWTLWWWADDVQEDWAVETTRRWGLPGVGPTNGQMGRKKQQNCHTRCTLRKTQMISHIKNTSLDHEIIKQDTWQVSATTSFMSPSSCKHLILARFASMFPRLGRASVFVGNPRPVNHSFTTKMTQSQCKNKTATPRIIFSDLNDKN